MQEWGLQEDQPIDFAVFAHGGINSETDAQAHAAWWVPQLYQRQIFPAFLMWENDLWSSLKDITQVIPAGGFPAFKDAVDADWRQPIAPLVE